MARVTVVVPNWNGAGHLTTCLASLRAQTFPDFHVVVVDNGSTDDSVPLVQTAYPWVHVIELSENLGFAAAANHGIRRTASEYVALLNNDTRAHEEWLECIVAALDQTPQADFAASKMLLMEPPHRIDSAGHIYSLWRCAGVDIGRSEPNKNRADRAWVFGACAGAALYRRSLFDDIGLFDEDFFLIYEDVDLNMRAQLAGHQCLYVPDALVYHKRRGSHDAREPSTRAIAIRNAIWVAGKGLPLPLLFVCALLTLARGTTRLLREVIANVAHRFVSIGKSSVVNATNTPLSAALRREMADGLKRLPSKRRQTQQIRRVRASELFRSMSIRPLERSTWPM
jgi:GT2 family glycosyltransferase